MIQVLFWILGCYALAAAAVHAASALAWKRGRDVKHYVLIAGNEQLQMEWYMRSLRRFSHSTGTEVQVTVVDRGSEDETIGIARCFTRYGMNVNIAAKSLFASWLSSFECNGLKPGNRGKDSGMYESCPDASLIERTGGGAQLEKKNKSERNEELHGQHGYRHSKSAWGKWQRFRMRWGQRSRGLMGSGDDENREMNRDRRSVMEPTHLMWMLQAEGIVTEPEHAVLVDLREPADLSKLPL